MKTAIVTLESAAPYSQSRLFTKQEVPALEKESHNDYEIRNWRHKQHWDKKTGEVYIPPMALKNALMEAAQYLGEKIPGKRNATWTKHFTAGILVSDPVMLGVQWDKTGSETFMCHADGKRSCGTRVPRTFPVIREWKASATFLVMDETITEDVFTHHAPNLSPEEGPWIAIKPIEADKGKTIGEIMAESCRLYDEVYGCGYGTTEDAALTALALAAGIRLWNEE